MIELLWQARKVACNFSSQTEHPQPAIAHFWSRTAAQSVPKCTTTTMDLPAGSQPRSSMRHRYVGHTLGRTSFRFIRAEAFAKIDAANMSGMSGKSAHQRHCSRDRRLRVARCNSRRASTYQRSMLSDRIKASSRSTPRYLTVLSIFV